MALRSWIYDKAILRLTKTWYAAVLQRLPNSANLLDVGIGTGSALAANAAQVLEKSISVVGVDIDADYVKQATKTVAKSGLEQSVEVRLQSIMDHVDGPYDAVYFSASFMLMPDPKAVLVHVKGLLKEDGRIFFTQTFQERRSKVMEKAKPLLKKVTTIDFGKVTYAEEFEQTLKECGVEIEEMEVLGKSGPRTYRLIVAKPEAS